MTALQHVALEVRRERVEATVAFYSLLGLRPVAPPPSLAERAAWLQGDATQVHLMYVDEPTTLPQGHAALVVQGYDDVLATLREAGHDPEPRAEHWGSPRAYVRDPAGNRVELMAFPPSPPG